MDRIKQSNQIFVSMHVNPSPKFVRMVSNFVAHANRNKRRACRDIGVGVEAGRLVRVVHGAARAGLVGWCRGRGGVPSYI
jgi:hypothetical protein